MFDFWLSDPGPCPICGAPHCSCCELADGRILINPTAAQVAALLRATAVQATLPPGAFTTGTYRGTPPRRRRR